MKSGVGFGPDHTITSAGWYSSSVPQAGQNALNPCNVALAFSISSRSGVWARVITKLHRWQSTANSNEWA
jgi:hypothetical protein